jgi:hypothetical protein
MMPKSPTKKPDRLEVVDPTGLTDSARVRISRLKAVYDAGGEKALEAALTDLVQKAEALSEEDPERAVEAAITYFQVKCALIPGFSGFLREAIRDSLAETGKTFEDCLELIRELTRKQESPSQRRH